MGFTTINYDIPAGCLIGGDIRRTLRRIGTRRTLSEWIVPTDRVADLPLDEWLRAAGADGFGLEFDVLDIAEHESGKVVRRALAEFDREFRDIVRGMAGSIEAARRKLDEALAATDAAGIAVADPTEEGRRHDRRVKNAVRRAGYRIADAESGVAVFGLTQELDDRIAAAKAALKARLAALEAEHVAAQAA